MVPNPAISWETGSVDKEATTTPSVRLASGETGLTIWGSKIEEDRTMAAPFDELLEAARTASRSAYCPYSHFHVGAAVWAGGRIFTGANVENASYGLTICAERTAAFAAILAGAIPIEAVAVACVDAPEGSDPTGLMPCGACRQVL